jgi:hypothetical protein
MAKTPMKKFKRYDEGGEVSDKDAGLKSSKDEDVGFFQRLRMGNIDDPSSEAYKRFGAGRGKAERNPVGESVSVNQPERDESVSVNEPRAVARPSMTTTAADMYQDYGIKAGRGSAGTSETMSPLERGSAGTSETVRPSKPAAERTYPDKNEPAKTQKLLVDKQKSTEMPSGGPGRGKSAEMPSTGGGKSADMAKPKTNMTLTPANTESRRKFSEGAGKIASGATSGIMDYFKSLDSRSGRLAKEKKLEKLKADPTSRERDFAKGGKVSASSRGDGIAQRGKTRGKMC